MSGPSKSACSCASFRSSGAMCSGSFLPVNGTMAQPVSPSSACVPVMPWNVNSMRMRLGRLSSIVNGASMPAPIIILPVMRRVWMPLSLSSPPRALIFFAMMSSTDSACATAPVATTRSAAEMSLRMDPPVAGGEHTRPWYARVRKILPWLAVVIVVADRARAVATAPPTDFDDAYMYLRYAHNLLRGHGISWNAGTPVYGATSLLHLFVVSAVGRTEWASAAAALLSIVALAAMAARFGRGPRWAYVAVIPLLVA